MPRSITSAGRRPRGSSPSNRSLERGIEILRAFRPGSELLGNGELVERTGLPKSTVSRLTQTLVRLGLLHAEVDSRAYRLAPAVLSLAHAMRTGSRVLSVAAPPSKRSSRPAGNGRGMRCGRRSKQRSSRFVAMATASPHGSRRW